MERKSELSVPVCLCVCTRVCVCVHACVCVHMSVCKWHSVFLPIAVQHFCLLLIQVNQTYLITRRLNSNYGRSETCTTGTAGWWGGVCHRVSLAQSPDSDNTLHPDRVRLSCLSWAQERTHCVSSAVLDVCAISWTHYLSFLQLLSPHTSHAYLTHFTHSSHALHSSHTPHTFLM